jgi:addiction module RelE/StbE family toxin
MVIRRTAKFKKQYKKLPPNIQTQFDNRLRLFVSNQTAVELNVHALKGKYSGYWSMNVNGDFRALYKRQGNEIIIFGLIGTHSQLYG